MFLAATDICTHCHETIYPDDEKFTEGVRQYHFECAEALELLEENLEE